MTSSSDTSPKATSKSSTSTRKISLEMIEAICDQGQSLNEVFDQHTSWAQLEDRDRRFVRRLVMGLLRHRGELDDRIKPLLRYPPGQSRVMNILRLGVLELTILEHPAHAAVSEAVQLAGKKFYPQKGLINAVLRKVAADKKPLRSHASRARRNIPKWLWQRWTSDHGTETTRSLAIEGLKEPPLDLFVQKNRDHYASELGGMCLSTHTVRLAEFGNIQTLAGFADGDWWVQDVAATLPVVLLDVEAGQPVLDLCAAPGGKTMQLSQTGADVTAVELVNKRCQIIRDNLQRTSLNADIVRANALKWEPERQWPKILLDAPCSATGTIRRNPDVLYHRKPDELQVIQDLQDALLSKARDWLMPGGEMVYATCSLLKSEGEERIEAFLEAHDDMEIVPYTHDQLGGIAVDSNDKGMVRTFPAGLAEQGGMDGFFMTKLRRRP